MSLPAIGVYRVVGRRMYRGHQPGTCFEARLDRGAEARAIRRGDIELVERVTPTLQPGTYRFPTPTASGKEEASDE